MNQRIPRVERKKVFLANKHTKFLVVLYINVSDWLNNDYQTKMVFLANNSGGNSYEMDQNYSKDND